MRLCCLGALVFAAVAPRAAAQTGPIERLEALGRTIRDGGVWRGSYHQEYVAAGMTTGEREDGVVWIAWPDRAQFRGGDPVVRVMGLDDRTVRLLDLEVSSCDDHTLDEDEWARIPLAAVLDPQRAVDRFAIISHGADGIALEPREPGGVARVEVTLGSDRMPVEVVVIDPQGAVTRLRFEGWSAGAAPPQGSWRPRPPTGIDCIAEDE